MFSTKTYFSTQLHSAKSESFVSKHQAIRWFQQASAFDTVKPNKSYAQALLSNVDGNVPSYPRVERNLGATNNIKLGIAGNNQGYSSAHTVAKIHKVPHVKLSSKAQSQPSSKSICKKQNHIVAKNFPQPWGSGSVTEVVAQKPEILSNNRFHVLQQLVADDLCVVDTDTKDSMENMSCCSNQPTLAKQVKNHLEGKKTKMGFLMGNQKIHATT